MMLPLILFLILWLSYSLNPIPRTQKFKGRPHGDLAINMMMFLTSYSDEWVSTLIANPLAHAYGSIEEQYISLLKEAKRIDTQGGGD
jgi:hypothetical protein